MDRSIIICNSSSQFSSEYVIDKVISDQDLLTLILSRLPIRKLICFQSVSKLWFYIINLLLRSPSALFLQHKYSSMLSPNDVLFVPLHDNHYTSSTFRTLPFKLANDPIPEMVRILHSCAGLLLCSSCPYNAALEVKCYLYNPTTNQLLVLSPYTQDVSFLCAAFLDFDPFKSPHYTVIICGEDVVPIKQIYIYSSQTCSWRLSGESFLSDIHFDNSVYSNGCIHWINDSTDCFYFNLDQGRLETIPRPLIRRTGMKFDIFESENHVHVVDVYASNNSLTVYEMKTDYSGWFLKYEVDLSPVAQVFPEMTTTPDDVHVLSLLRKENFEEDSFLVLHILGKAIRYNLVDTSFKGIWDISFVAHFGLDIPMEPAFPPKKLKAFQFIESLSYLQLLHCCWFLVLEV